MQPTIWTSLARYCSELAPVVGPLLAATSELAQAVDRAALPSASTRNLITTELAATAAMRRGSYNGTPYRCPICDAWHTTTYDRARSKQFSRRLSRLLRDTA